MTNVNDTLSDNDRLRLTKQLAKLFSADSAHNAALFNSLYTSAEQVMSVKRLAIIIMLREGYTKYRIAQALDMSHATVAKHQRKLKEGAYAAILEAVASKQFNQERFWNIIEVLLRAGLPPRAGPGRWSTIAPAAVRGSRSYRKTL